MVTTHTPVNDSSGQEQQASRSISQQDRETMFQVSLMQALAEGDFAGSVTVGEYKQVGDTGIGTFHALNGELIMMDGVVYRAAGDGTVEVAPDEETIPFGNTTFFDVDETFSITDVADHAHLLELLDARVEALSPNSFFMCRIDGLFRTVNVRSEYAAQEPYPTIVEALEMGQTLFDYEDVSGTMVGVYCPLFMGEMNVAGWHFHFISDDRTKGGHVLGVDIESATVSLDQTKGFQMLLPSSAAFEEMDFSVDRKEDVHRAERGV